MAAALVALKDPNFRALDVMRRSPDQTSLAAAFVTANRRNKFKLLHEYGMPLHTAPHFSPRECKGCRGAKSAGLVTIPTPVGPIGIGGAIVELAFGILFGGIVLTLALAIGLGSRDLVIARGVPVPSAVQHVAPVYSAPLVSRFTLTGQPSGYGFKAGPLAGFAGRQGRDADFDGWPGAEAVESTELHETRGVTKLTQRMTFRDKAGRDHMNKTDGFEASYDNVEDLLRSLLD